MKILQSKSKKVFVMTQSGGGEDGEQCPRIAFASGTAKFRDDYKGHLKVKSRLLAKLFF